MVQPLIAQLIDAGLQEHAERVIAIARPAIRMTVIDVATDDWPIRTSKLGGAPDVSANFDWPAWGGAPLAFIGQVNLADVAAFDVARDLPPNGLLSFFYSPDQTAWGFDPKDRGSARVYWFPESIEVQRLDFPGQLSDDGRFPAGQVAFREVLTLPPHQARDLKVLGFSPEEDDAYFDMWESWQDQIADGEEHQLLGHPNPVQDEMQLECQLVSNGIYCGTPDGYRDPRRAALELGAGDWQLLAQVDSDDTLQMMWGDVGKLYFWIRAEDLVSRQFDRIWMILQCS
jgi:uncharacterized protein YwqG